MKRQLARHRRAPLGFIAPCQPILAKIVPKSDHWLHEIKHDGYRVVAVRDGERVRLWSRNARDWSTAFPRIAGGLRRLWPTGLMLDGEAVVLRDDGRSEFHALRTHPKEAVLVAFDLLVLGGHDLRPLPLIERRRQLATILADAPDGLCLSEYLEGTAGGAMYRHACEMGLEGIVSKRKDSPYRSGSYSSWRTIKCPAYRRDFGKS